MHFNPIFTTIYLLAARVVADYGELIGVPNNALGKCSADTTLKAGDLCSTENWGAHGCGPGAEGNIVRTYTSESDNLLSPPRYHRRVPVS